MECIWAIVGAAAVSMVATLGTSWFGHWLRLSNDHALRLKSTTSAQEFYRSCLALSLDQWHTGSVNSLMQQATLPR